MTTWNDVKRSEIPWDWRAESKRLMFTPQELVTRIHQLVLAWRTMMPDDVKPEEEVVDMDELSKSTETTTKEDEELEDSDSNGVEPPDSEGLDN